MTEERFDKFSSFVNEKVLRPLFGLTEDGSYKARLNLQDLNFDSRKPWVKHSRLPLHGRGWLRAGKFTFTFEWDFASTSCRITYDQNHGDSGHTVGFALPPVALWLGLEAPWGHWLNPKRSRQFGFRIFDRALWWDWGSDPNYGSSSDPWWKQGNWRPERTLFGPWVYKSKSIENRQVLVPMPEGSYPATVELKYEVRGFKRSPWKHRTYGATVEMAPGFSIPHSGKGENSWDCGEDATYSLSCPARTVEEAIGKMVGSVLGTRRKRGDPATWPRPPGTPNAEDPDSGSQSSTN